MPAHHVAADAPLDRPTFIQLDGQLERSAMSDTPPGLGDISAYEIRTQGRISETWSALFEGLTLLQEADGTTVIRCPALDQAALHGLLAKVRDLGLALISVTPTPTTPGSTSRSLEP
jgi:hypothetical protein